MGRPGAIVRVVRGRLKNVRSVIAVGAAVVVVRFGGRIIKAVVVVLRVVGSDGDWVVLR